MVACDHAGFGAVGGQTGEVDFVQLEPVERAVVVAAGADWPGQDDAGRVNGLGDALEVGLAGDFLDEDGGEALGAEFLVDAEEVDLDDGDGVLADAEFGRDAEDAGEEDAGFGCADADMPAFFPAGGFEGPAEEGFGVVETEHGLFVFDVVEGEKVVDFL